MIRTTLLHCCKWNLQFCLCTKLNKSSMTYVRLSLLLPLYTYPSVKVLYTRPAWQYSSPLYLHKMLARTSFQVLAHYRPFPSLILACFITRIGSLLNKATPVDVARIGSWNCLSKFIYSHHTKGTGTRLRRQVRNCHKYSIHTMDAADCDFRVQKCTMLLLRW